MIFYQIFASFVVKVLFKGHKKEKIKNICVDICRKNDIIDS